MFKVEINSGIHNICGILIKYYFVQNCRLALVERYTHCMWCIHGSCHSSGLCMRTMRGRHRSCTSAEFRSIYRGLGSSWITNIYNLKYVSNMKSSRGGHLHWRLYIPYAREKKTNEERGCFFSGVGAYNNARVAERVSTLSWIFLKG